MASPNRSPRVVSATLATILVWALAACISVPAAPDWSAGADVDTVVAEPDVSDIPDSAGPVSDAVSDGLGPTGTLDALDGAALPVDAPGPEVSEPAVDGAGADDVPAADVPPPDVLTPLEDAGPDAVVPDAADGSAALPADSDVGAGGSDTAPTCEEIAQAEGWEPCAGDTPYVCDGDHAAACEPYEQHPGCWTLTQGVACGGSAPCTVYSCGYLYPGGAWGVGGHAVGIRVLGSTGVSVTGLDVAALGGGPGGDVNDFTFGAIGGVGGQAIGVHLVGSSGCEIGTGTIADLVGGTGGASGAWGGGTGGLVAAVRLDGSSSNTIESLAFDALEGGPGGASTEDGVLGGLAQEAYGIFLADDSLDNTIAMTNTYSDEPTVYRYGASAEVLSGLVLQADVNPTNLGKIALVESVGVEIVDCAIAHFRGPAGAWSTTHAKTPPAPGAGVLLEGCESCVVSGCQISDIVGGAGQSAADPDGSGQAGATAGGIAVRGSEGTAIQSNVITGITGGRGGAARFGNHLPGGSGGIGAGIYLGSASVSGVIGGNELSGVAGGDGGEPIDLGAAKHYASGGAAQQGYGLYLEADSLANAVAMDNDLEGTPIVYLHDVHDVEIEGLVLTGPGNPTNLGKLVVVDSSNVAISGCAVNGFVGESGDTGPVWTAGSSGARGAGVLLRGCTGCTVTGCAIEAIAGGMGGVSGASSSGGTGGQGVGVAIESSPECVLSGNTLSAVHGGPGGAPGRIYEGGGTGGWAAGVSVAGSAGCQLEGSVITDIQGGVGGSIEGYKPPAISQVGFGVHLSPDALETTIDSSNTLEGEQIVYLYGAVGVTLSDLDLTAPVNGTNLGKLVVVDSSDVTIDGCQVSGFVGTSGPSGDHGAGENPIPPPAEEGVGIRLSGCDGCAIHDCDVWGISGGQGGVGAPETAGGDGGDGIGILVDAGSVASASRVTIHSVGGGSGSKGGAARGFLVSAAASLDADHARIWDLFGAGADGAAAFRFDASAGSSLDHVTVHGIGDAGTVGVGVDVAAGQSQTVAVSNSILSAAATACLRNAEENSFAALAAAHTSLHACGEPPGLNALLLPTVTFADPLFVDEDLPDLHLLPGSPAIDTGDPSSPYCEEPAPNGGRANRGAYGDTAEATSAPGADQTPCEP